MDADAGREVRGGECLLPSSSHDQICCQLPFLAFFVLRIVSSQRPTEKSPLRLNGLADSKIQRGHCLQIDGAQIERGLGAGRPELELLAEPAASHRAGEVEVGEVVARQVR